MAAGGKAVSWGLTRKRRLAVLLAFGFRCRYCGVGLTVDTATIDHATPLSRGGTHAIENLVAACLSCNQRKADKERMP